MMRRKLDAEVRAILESTAAFRQADAGPGCGKTSLLTLLIDAAIRQGTAPVRILAMSHTNSTVDRFRSKLHKSACDASVQTCHSLALKLIQDNRTALGIVGAVEINPDKQTKQRLALMAQAIALAAADWATHSSTKSVPDKRRVLVDAWFKLLSPPKSKPKSTPKSSLKLCKLYDYHVSTCSVMATTLAYHSFASWSEFAKPLTHIFEHFIKLKAERGLFDFGDLLTLAIRVMEMPSAQRVIAPCELLLVDEYQDCTPHQVRFISLLARFAGRAVVVGDRDQVLYEFNGARYISLTKALPGVPIARFPLTMSHRLHASNAALADSIRASARSARFPIRTKRDGPKPTLCVCSSGKQQVRSIIKLVRELLAQGVPASDIAILARLKMQLHPIEQALRAAGVETDRIGAKRNYKLALKVLAMVKLVRRLGPAKRAGYAEGLKAMFPEFEYEEEKWETEASKLRKARLNNTLASQYALAAAVYLRLLGKRADTKVERFDLNRWKALSTQFRTVRSMVSEVERLGRSTPVISATVHGAKGGEWDHVILAGVTEGRLPLRLDRHRPVSLKQERRVMYVAVTRAIEQLHLFHSPFGHPLKGEPSRYLADAVSQDLVELVSAKRPQLASLDSVRRRR